MTMLKKTTLITTATSIAALLFASPALAQITNPVIGETLGGNPTVANSGGTFVFYFIIMWKAIINMGAIAMLIYFVWGSLDWVVAGGDKGKIETARNKITQALIGMIILASSFVIIAYVNKIAFGENFDLLELQLPTGNTEPVMAP